MLRRVGRLGVVSILAVLLLVFTIYRQGSQRNHYLNPSLTTNSLSPATDWNPICRSHGFSLFPPQQPRRVYDLILMSSELDWLEIRLQTHHPYVDYFVILESPTTFTGSSKPLHLAENWDRFAPFHHKIIYKEVHDPLTSTWTWDHETWFRNSMLYEVFPTLSGTAKAASKDDVLIVSDMDELVKPAALLLLRYCTFPHRLTLGTGFYYYSFQYLHRSTPQWPHPQATTFGDGVEKTLAPNDLRMGLLEPGKNYVLAYISRWRNTATLWNAGWHCSSCFSTLKEMQTKMQSFSHTPLNTPENRDPATIMHRVRNGLDLFGREGQAFDRIEGNRDVPQFVLEQFEREGRFRYLLDRDGEEAGFEDWDAGGL